MRAVNRVDALLYASGVLTPRQTATLEVTGRRSGRQISLPITVTELDGQRYLVAMLGPNANWVRNVRAAGGRAVLRRRGREQITLDEVPVTERGRPPQVGRVSHGTHARPLPSTNRQTTTKAAIFLQGGVNPTDVRKGSHYEVMRSSQC
ncbi:nitroreductase/quinone reductase family protein [Sphaerisporangium sp. NBC_01403]|uniref:nitroreductase/quinone reductase family protein n=1 Tax=Sphaerisporangium sp. NBC_01403 TaxID=2903599 RepID=UPI00325079C6